MAMIAQDIEIRIGKACYGVEFLSNDSGKVYRLTKDDGQAVYDVCQGEGRTTCDCPDWQHRHAGLPYSEGCKHIKALVKVGMVENVSPKPLETQETLWEAFESYTFDYDQDEATSFTAALEIDVNFVSYEDTTIGRESIDWRVVGMRHQAGESLAVLGASIGIPRQTVYRKLKKLGLK